MGRTTRSVSSNIIQVYVCNEKSQCAQAISLLDSHVSLYDLTLYALPTPTNMLFLTTMDYFSYPIDRSCSKLQCHH